MWNDEAPILLYENGATKNSRGREYAGHAIQRRQQGINLSEFGVGSARHIFRNNLSGNVDARFDRNWQVHEVVVRHIDRYSTRIEREFGRANSGAKTYIQVV